MVYAVYFDCVNASCSRRVFHVQVSPVKPEQVLLRQVWNGEGDHKHKRGDQELPGAVRPSSALFI